MDCPGRFPAGFSRHTAIRCAELVEIAYALYPQWSDTGKPSEADMKFTPLAHGDLVFSNPFWRTLTYRKSIATGPKNTARRFKTIVEHTPAGVCASALS